MTKREKYRIARQCGLSVRDAHEISWYPCQHGCDQWMGAIATRRNGEIMIGTYGFHTGNGYMLEPDEELVLDSVFFEDDFNSDHEEDERRVRAFAPGLRDASPNPPR